MKNPLTIKTPEDGFDYRQLVESYGSPLLLLNCDAVREQFRLLKEALPGVDFFYAIKSLPHPDVIETLVQEGAGFDIATSGEIEIIRKLPISPRRTIHTHPIKRNKDIREALRFGCTTFVVDNIEEIRKFTPFRQRVGLLLRVCFRNPNATVDLSKKFGCPPEEALSLLKACRDLGLHVKGFSFHVGSQCKTADSHVQAINACNDLFAEIARDDSINPPSILDIGGGFPVNYGETPQPILDFCAPIREALARLPGNVRVIAEPGRFLSAPAMTAVSTVMGKAKRGDRIWYYLDDGVYGSYSGQLFDHTLYPLTVFGDSNSLHNSVLAGPTCDSIDVVAEDIMLPELAIGDIIVGHMMGAYTDATATNFNCFDRARIVVLNKHTTTISRWFHAV